MDAGNGPSVGKQTVTQMVDTIKRGIMSVIHNIPKGNAVGQASGITNINLDESCSKNEYKNADLNKKIENYENNVDNCIGSDSEPTGRKRLLSNYSSDGNHKKFKLNCGNSTVPWKKRTYDSVLNDLHQISLKRKKAMMKYKIPFSLRLSSMTSSPPVDLIIPIHLLRRFRSFLRTRNKIPAVLYPAVFDDSLYGRQGQDVKNAEVSSDRICIDQADVLPKVSPLVQQSTTNMASSYGVMLKPSNPEIATSDNEDSKESGRSTIRSTHSNIEMVCCPICSNYFPSGEIEIHAMDCALKNFQD